MILSDSHEMLYTTQEWARNGYKKLKLAQNKQQLVSGPATFQPLHITEALINQLAFAVTASF